MANDKGSAEGSSTSPDKQWEGYSDFQSITTKIHDDVNSAVEAYSYIDSKYTQGAGITPQEAVKIKKSILQISKRLFFEIKRNKHTEDYEEIWERWSGEDGHMAKLEDVNLRQERPEWLSQHVDDIVEAGWRLGYLKAGIEKPSDPTDDDQQAKEMFQS